MDAEILINCVRTVVVVTAILTSIFHYWKDDYGRANWWGICALLLMMTYLPRGR